MRCNEAFTDDPDRLARFEREAKVLASLNRANAGPDFGVAKSFLFDSTFRSTRSG